MDKVSTLVIDDAFYKIDDFFELLLYATERKSVSLSQFPYLLEFSIGAFYPEHKEVKEAMNDWTRAQLDQMLGAYFKNVRFDKFRDDIDPRNVMEMMIWMADGYIHQRRSLHKPIDLDELLVEFKKWMSMFKQYAYKEDYQ